MRSVVFVETDPDAFFTRCSEFGWSRWSVSTTAIGPDTSGPYAYMTGSQVLAVSLDHPEVEVVLAPGYACHADEFRERVR
jgi:hypothetical protein